MSITDELRVFAKRWPCTDYIHKDMLAIADRIDAEHESKVAEVASGWDYWESTHIELPKDADGVPWNVGDRDEDCNVVIELRLTSDGWFVITDGEWPYRPDPYRPERKRHYHEPTVEDVLREFADEVYADADNEIRDRDFLCAKYAKRLTLVDGEDA